MKLNASDLQSKGFVQAQDGSWFKPAYHHFGVCVRNLGTGGSMTKTKTEQTEVPACPRKPLLNKTEWRYKAILLSRGIVNIMEQAITLRLDPPYKTYRADLAYLEASGLCLVEVKGPHRFRAAGIAKAALAAKTYPQFRFRLADWSNGQFKETLLSS